MAAAGLPVPREDHAEAVARTAIAMREEVARHAERIDRPLAVRVGINTGSLVTGVIGKRKYAYDLWGDAVNTAARMESHGLAGEIQVTRPTYERLRERYELRPRGTIEIKGKGPMETWLLVGEDGSRAHSPVNTWSSRISRS